MAMWHLTRVDTAGDGGALSLVCDTGETPWKFTLYDSDTGMSESITLCVDRTLDETEVLALLTAAGYDPSEWHS